MKLCMQVEVDERYMTVCPNPRSRLRTSEILKYAKMADFKAVLCANMHVVKKLNGELWYSKTVSKF